MTSIYNAVQKGSVEAQMVINGLLERAPPDTRASMTPHLPEYIRALIAAQSRCPASLETRQQQIQEQRADKRSGSRWRGGVGSLTSAVASVTADPRVS
jgi:hypothetical protein